MSALKLNGIEVDAAVAVTSDIKQTARDIGEREPAADGSMAATRSARKLDLSFRTVLLSLSDAAAWWSFFTGEGEVWSFDASLYGSKGTGPSALSGASFSAGSAKYGDGKLSITAGGGSITWAGVAANSFGKSSDWTVCVWRNAGSWEQYAVNSAGQKWVDGVRNDGALTDWLSVSGGDVTLSNTSGTVTFDDLVVVPYVMPLAWPPQVHAAGAAFGLLPFLSATGDFVAEQATRQVVGVAEEGGYQKVAGAVLQALDVELLAR